MDPASAMLLFVLFQAAENMIAFWNNSFLRKLVVLG
jgi:hypothetical protein